MVGLQMRLCQEQILESPYQSALRLYENSERIIVPVRLGEQALNVPAALVDAEEFESIWPGEKYAATIGGMFFISQQTPLEYRQFAAFHELAEHAAPRGFDFTGLAAHYQALVVELGYARCILNREQHAQYLAWRKEIERTRFFKLKHEDIVRSATEYMGDIFATLPRFLTQRKKQLVELCEEDF
ncbi:MAG: hypothetical protein KJ574_00690 [Nanoarchaeota archaeon]|nr:hypothetical protein [Nanoarchaeota archaeon]